VQIEPKLLIILNVAKALPGDQATLDPQGRRDIDSEEWDQKSDQSSATANLTSAKLRKKAQHTSWAFCIAHWKSVTVLATLHLDLRLMAVVRVRQALLPGILDHSAGSRVLGQPQSVAGHNSEHQRCDRRQGEADDGGYAD
jgi:hypothetical protein